MKHLFHHWLPIPQIEIFPEREWFLIAGIRGLERRLQKEFKARAINYYLPRARKKNDLGVTFAAGPLFPGKIFAALTSPSEIQWICEFAPGYQVQEQEQSRILADLRFIKLAERLNGEYPFRWEPRLPDTKNAIILHDKTGNGHLQIEWEADSVKLWFSFFEGSKIISFSMTQEEFSSLQK